MNGRERILNHLEGREVDRLPFMPITMMFAADQIGVCYRDYSADFRVLAQGQIFTAEKFDFDYVNTMSDPAREAADCGAKIEFFDNQPAAIVEEEALLADKTTLASLVIPDPLGGGRMHNGVRAVAELVEKAGKEKLVEGWIEGPCAEGADLRGINSLMMDFYDDPAFIRDLFDFVVEMELRFARAQVDAGADSIGIGDAAASLVGPQLYEEFIWPCEKKLVDGIHDMGVKVRLHICGNTRHILEAMGRLGCDIIDLDFLAPMAEAREKMGPDQMLLGNVDPVRVIRDGDANLVTSTIAACHSDAAERYIVSAGCEIPRDTPEQNLRALGDYARSHAPGSN